MQYIAGLDLRHDFHSIDLLALVAAKFVCQLAFMR